MKMFAAIIETSPDYVERRQPHREAHLERLRKMRDEGKVLMGGAWEDPVDGALIIFQAETMGEVWRMLAEDPYCRAGLWRQMRIREWNAVIK